MLALYSFSVRCNRLLDGTAASRHDKMLNVWLELQQELAIFWVILGLEKITSSERANRVL
jgi:hypothetical protein